MSEGLKPYWSGGFNDLDETVMVVNNDATPIGRLRSTHKEAEQRMIIHVFKIQESVDHAQQ